MRLNNQNGEKSKRRYQQNGEFRTLLTLSGLSQAAFGRRIDVHPNTVSRWSAGHVEVPGPALAYLRLYIAMKAALGD